MLFNYLKRWRSSEIKKMYIVPQSTFNLNNIRNYKPIMEPYKHIIVYLRSVSYGPCKLITITTIKPFYIHYKRFLSRYDELKRVYKYLTLNKHQISPAIFFGKGVL